MTGLLKTAMGDVWQLPQLLQWEVLRTEGSSCDWARVRFLWETNRLRELEDGVWLQLQEDDTVAFFGTVDDVSVTVDENGSCAELSARGLMALLMDSQLREACYSSFGESDALTSLVKPFGVDRVRVGGLPAVRNFSWGTGTTPWTALCGYCRHAADFAPRFLADGTLALDRPEQTSWQLTDGCAVKALRYEARRYGLVAKQIVVHPGGWQQEFSCAPAKAMGITVQKVAMETGDTLKCTWRTGPQRLEDALSRARVLTVTLAGLWDAEPEDEVEVMLKCFSDSAERFRVGSVHRKFSAEGTVTVLELKGGYGDVAGQKAAAKQ